MDRKTEIKKDLWNILKDVYKLNEEIGVTNKQQEFLDKALDYLDANISLRRKVVKDVPLKKEKKDGYINPDWVKFDS